MSTDFKPQAVRNQHASTEQTSAEQAYTDLQDFLQTYEQKRKLYPRAVLVGGLAGLLAVAFQWSLVGSEALRHRMILWTYQYPHWGRLLPMLISAAGAGVAIYMVRNIAPEAAGSGIPHLLVVGVLAGVLGVAFNRGLLSILDLYARWGEWLSRLRGWPAKLGAGVVGAAVGLLGWFLPVIVGSGHQLGEVVLVGGVGLSIIPLWLACPALGKEIT